MWGSAVNGDHSELTPTEELLLGLLTSRYVLGDTSYTVSSQHKKALNSLVAKGLASYNSGIVQATFCASPTPEALAMFLAPYVPAALDPRCKSRYFGPRVAFGDVGCRLEARHDGAHEGTYLPDWDPIMWTDAESGGRDDPLFMERIAAIDADDRVTDPCCSPFEYLAYDTVVVCGLPRGHDPSTNSRHLWAGDREFRPWMKPIAWTAEDAERAQGHASCPHGGPCGSNRGPCPRGH